MPLRECRYISGTVRIPMRGLVRVNGAAEPDDAGNRHNRRILRLEDEGQGSATALAHDDNHTALAGLVLHEAAVAAVGLVIGRAISVPSNR